MRYIWHPDKRPRMHIQFHDDAGRPYNSSLCGIVFPQGHRTINAPFALGQKVCKHCKSIVAGKKRVIDRRAA
jgi:NMD protein affecting ribosome stability and mRNA decay